MSHHPMSRRPIEPPSRATAKVRHAGFDLFYFVFYNTDSSKNPLLGWSVAATVTIYTRTRTTTKAMIREKSKCACCFFFLAATVKHRQ
jgi:hypothetical protein